MAAAPAEPAALKELSQTKAWVSTARWTVASVSTEQRTMIRGMASAVKATPKPSSSGERARSDGRQPIARKAAAAASCTRWAGRQRRRPYSQPDKRANRGCRRERPRRWPSDAREGGGAVRRWAAKQRPPNTTNVAANRVPADG